MRFFLKQHKSYYILITILLLNFCYLIIRTTPIINYIAQIVKTGITISSKTFKMRDFMILLFFMIGCVACFFLPQKYYQLITKKVKVKYIFIGLFFIGVAIFQFTKTQWLFVPDLHSDNHSYIWEDGKKTQTIRMKKLSDEAAYITTAKVIKENPFKNYFHLHELEKYPEDLRAQIWRCTGLHPLLYFYYLSLFPNEIWMRFGNFLAYTTLIIFVYLIAKKIIDEKIAIITAVLYWAAPYFFLRTGLQVSNDLFVSLFVAIAIYFILDYHRQRQLMLSGLFIALALLSKYTAIFSIPCIVFYILLKNKKNPIKKIVSDNIVFFSPIILLFGTWILSLIGTEIGQSQYNFYIQRLFIGTITQLDQITSKTTFGNQTWITPLFQIPNSFGLGVILLALLGSYSLIRSAKLRLFKNFELLTLISMMFIFIVGAIVVNPLLRYSMPGLFVIPLLAAFGIQDFLETEKTKIIAVVLAMNFLIAKCFILILEYPYALSQRGF